MSDPTIFKNQTDARIAKMDKGIAAAKGTELTKQMVVKYEQYVGNMERSAREQKSVLKQILDENFVPDSLKQRARALMANPRTRWLD